MKCNFGQKTYFVISNETCASCSIMKSKVWFHTKLCSNQFNYPTKRASWYLRVLVWYLFSVKLETEHYIIKMIVQAFMGTELTNCHSNGNLQKKTCWMFLIKIIHMKKCLLTHFDKLPQIFDLYELLDKSSNIISELIR